ncbi:PQQ-like beta-propeller repeat protein [Streptomyces sp. NBC_00390]|uniref:outer membrane protein assembly factor BamB family protein n=1 Tax=Streptomyces sp. NBC_00390 TaxID=2975736 RepID=UPI002E1E131E
MCLTLAVVLSGLGGCSGGSSGAGGKGPVAGPEVGAKAYDPPLKFGKGVKLAHDEDVKTWGFSLLGVKAYVRTDKGLDAYDTRTGRKLWSSALNRKNRYTGTAGVPEDNRHIPPVFVQQGKRTEALFAFSDYTEGSGTSVGRTDVHLRAVDTDSGKVSWTTRLPAPTGMGISDMEPTVVGAENGTAVVAVFAYPDDSKDSDSAVTYAVDLGTHQVTWKQEGFAAHAVDSGTVVGAQVRDRVTFGTLGGWHAEEGDLALTGRSIADGTVRWKNEGHSSLEVNRVGGGLFASESALHDARTGEAVAGVNGAYLTCYYDQQSVVVCAGDETVQGVDTSSRKVLWTISEDDTSRKMPTIQAAWHGAIYANAAPDYVVLDAKTGKDRTTFDGPHLFLVDEYAGMDRDMVAYPATG